MYMQRNQETKRRVRWSNEYGQPLVIIREIPEKLKPIPARYGGIKVRPAKTRRQLTPEEIARLLSGR